MVARAGTFEARMLERGWRVVGRGRAGDAILECLECLGRQTRRLYAFDRTCAHVPVDEASRYEDDPVCRLLVHRFGPMTLAEIGDALGITRERVRQIEAKALPRLRAGLEREGFGVDDVREALADADARDARHAWLTAPAGADGRSRDPHRLAEYRERYAAQQRARAAVGPTAGAAVAVVCEPEPVYPTKKAASRARFEERRRLGLVKPRPPSVRKPCSDCGGERDTTARRCAACRAANECRMRERNKVLSRDRLAARRAAMTPEERSVARERNRREQWRSRRRQAGLPVEEETMSEKVCVKCGAGFEGATSARYCSDACRPARATRPARKRGKRKAAATMVDVAEHVVVSKRRGRVSVGVVAGGPRELLELAGYQVREVRTPAGVALFVDEGGAE